MRGGVGMIAMLLMSAVPGWAQDSSGISIDPNLQEVPPPPSSTPRQTAGQTAESASGQVGIRQTRDQVENINPIARINNRIQNRVQARVRNRIDRYYDPRANATSPFEAAGQETSRAGQRQRR